MVVKNSLPISVTLTWCCSERHYPHGTHLNAAGNHKWRSHILSPGGRLLFDENAPNGLTIIGLATSVGLL